MFAKDVRIIRSATKVQGRTEEQLHKSFIEVKNSLGACHRY